MTARMQFIVTVTLAGNQAAPVASILQTILASGVADLPLLDLLRAELGTVHVFRDDAEVESPDWRIVRATVEKVTPLYTVLAWPADDAGEVMP